MSKKVTDGKRETFFWTSQMDDAFIQAMLKEQDKGNRIDGTFTSQAYINMVDELSKTLDKAFNKNHLNNHLKTLKDHFAQCYDIFCGVSLSGFAWNSETKLFEAEEEVWEALMVDKPDAAKWKKKTISNYNEMLELFGRDRATGGAAETAKERRNRMSTNQQMPETIDEIDRMIEVDEISLENFNNGDDIQVTSTTPASQTYPPNATTSKRKKRKVDEQDVENFKITAATIGDVANAIRESTNALRKNTKVLERSHRSVYSGEEMYNPLELMGVEPENMSRAYIFLVENPEKAPALFVYPLQMRKSLLRDIMDKDY